MAIVSGSLSWNSTLNLQIHRTLKSKLRLSGLCQSLNANLLLITSWNLVLWILSPYSHVWEPFIAVREWHKQNITWQGCCSDRRPIQILNLRYAGLEYAYELCKHPSCFVLQVYPFCRPTAHSRDCNPAESSQLIMSYLD